MAVTLKVEQRATRPRSIRKNLRKEGKVPGVVYGNKMETTSISVDGATLSKALRENGINAVYTLELDGKKIPTLLYGSQLDTFTSGWIHVEFLAVDMSEKQEVEAEIYLEGTPEGVKMGGTLAQNLYNVMVSATPDKLPDRIEVDVTKLQIGDAITVADIPINPDYSIITDGEEQVAAVVEPTVREEDSEEETTEEVPTVE